jgi:predicted enzyme related to lactoylglutathione lyase
MSRVIHFEIHADDPQRAVDFYQHIFDWQINKWDGAAYWLITTGVETEAGINGAIVQRSQASNDNAVTAYVCIIDVDSVDDALAKISSYGGTIEHPKMAVPHVGWLAYAKDTEGNIFGIMQSDLSAE